MGMVHGKGIATMVESLPEMTCRVPDSMTLEQAASIPVVYLTVNSEHLIHNFFPNL